MKPETWEDVLALKDMYHYLSDRYLNAENTALLPSSQILNSECMCEFLKRMDFSINALFYSIDYGPLTRNTREKIDKILERMVIIETDIITLEHAVNA